MIDPAYFRDQPTLTTPNLRLEPLGAGHLADALAAHRDKESRRLTGTHVVLTEDELLGSIISRRDAHDRADWAIIRASDEAYVGEVTLRELHPYNETMDFHIALGNPAIFGKGYGSEATKVVIDYGLEVVGLHRITLQVVDFNTRAQRVYAKIGFHQEGVLREAWYWDGEWSDIILMAIIGEH